MGFENIVMRSVAPHAPGNYKAISFCPAPGVHHLSAANDVANRQFLQHKTSEMNTKCPTQNTCCKHGAPKQEA